MLSEKIDVNSTQYVWQENWIRIPASAAQASGGRTHGVAVTRSGQIVVFAQANPAVYFFTPEGKEVAAWGNQFAGAHGLTLVEEAGSEFLWLTDQHSGAVVKTTLDGHVIQEIERPPELPYKPTWVAVNPKNEDVWVTDGYASHVIRRYAKSGVLISTLTGEGAPDRFLCPHGIAFGPDGNLYVTDRSRKRIVIYDGDGTYLRHRDDVVHSPCMFAFHGGKVYVPELFGDLKILDSGLNIVSRVGTNPDVRPEGGWPDQDGWGLPTLPGWPNLSGTAYDRPERFIAPHSAAVALGGTIYVAEWVLGGRLSKLTPK